MARWITYLVLLAAWGRMEAACDAMERAGRFYLARQFSKAAAAYKSCLAADPSDKAAAAGQIRALLKDLRAGAAREAAREAASRWPGDAEINDLLGDACLQDMRFDEARLHYLRNWKVSPPRGRTFLGLGRLHDSDFRRKSAREMYARAYELAPRDPDVLRHYATVVEGAAARIAVLRRYLEVAAGDDPERIEFARVHVAFLEKLGDRRTDILESPIREYEIPLLERSRKAALAVSLNEAKAIRLELDTGASGILINPRAARAAGIATMAEARIRGIGVDGLRPAQYAIAERVRIGDVAFRDCLVRVAPTNLAGVDGLIGSNVFRHFLQRIDFGRRVMRLSPLPPAAHSSDAEDDWSDYDRAVPPALAGFVPARRSGHLLLLPARVNDKQSGWFGIDSGAFTTLLDYHFARSVSFSRPSELSIRGLSGSAGMSFTLPNLRLAVAGWEYSQERVPAIDLRRLQSSLDMAVAGLLGFDALGRNVLSLNYRDGLVKISVE